MVRIRLRRVGRTKAPAYRIVVADSKSPRDGKFIEIIGQYAPRSSDEQKINLDVARATHWLSVGAQPSDTVRSILRRAGVLKAMHEERLARGRQASAVALSEAPAASAASAAPTEPATPVAGSDASPSADASLSVEA
ncbi:MAG TPA: 30S ribosomal protein S16 [Gemmatirosa sp.]